MIELQEKTDIWTLHGAGGWIVVPTNGYVKRNGEAVMGRGLAFQCSKKFPVMPKLLVERLKDKGNHVNRFPEPLRIYTFPVKHYWEDRAELGLILRSLREIALMAYEPDVKIYMPRVGCGNGTLKWATVRPLVALLDNRFIVVDINEPLALAKTVKETR